MLVFCEECGARNDISESVFNDEKHPARCDSCHDILNKAIARKLKMAQQSSFAETKATAKATAKAKVKEQEALAAEAQKAEEEAEAEAEAEAEEEGGIIEPAACERMETTVMEIIDLKDLDRNVTINEF